MAYDGSKPNPPIPNILSKMQMAQRRAQKVYIRRSKIEYHYLYLDTDGNEIEGVGYDYDKDIPTSFEFLELQGNALVFADLEKIMADTQLTLNIEERKQFVKELEWQQTDIVLAHYTAPQQLLPDGRIVEVPEWKGRLFEPISAVKVGDIIERNRDQDADKPPVTGEPLLFVSDVKHPYNSKNMSLDLTSEEV